MGGPMAELMVELYVQAEDDGTDRQCLRVAAGTTIRAVLERAGHGELIAFVERGQRGLARWGRRAALDDPIGEASRIEVRLPITADAKAWRRERVAARRASSSRGGWTKSGRSRAGRGP